MQQTKTIATLEFNIKEKDKELLHMKVKKPVDIVENLHISSKEVEKALKLATHETKQLINKLLELLKVEQTQRLKAEEQQHKVIEELESNN